MLEAASRFQFQEARSIRNRAAILRRGKASCRRVRRKLCKELAALNVELNVGPLTMTRLMQQLASVAVIRQPREIHETLRINDILLEQERRERDGG